MNVVDELAELRKRERELRATPCVGCGHPFVDHGQVSTKCFFPRVVTNGPAVCRCRAFIDPADCLDLKSEPTGTDRRQLRSKTRKAG